MNGDDKKELKMLIASIIFSKNTLIPSYEYEYQYNRIHEHHVLALFYVFNCHLSPTLKKSIPALNSFRAELT
jgi:HKD family nuclease